MDNWRSDIMGVVVNSVEQLSTLPSKRMVKIPYRGQEVREVQVMCVADQIDLAMMSRFKAAAVASGDLLPLEAEALLGCVSTPADQLLKVHPDFMQKVKQNVKQHFIALIWKFKKYISCFKVVKFNFKSLWFKFLFLF